MMRSAIKLMNKKLRSFETALILGGLITFIFITYLIAFSPEWFLADGEKYENVELIKILLLGLGGIGGLYGLILNAKRTKTAQEQMYNETLGRGLSLLTKKDPALRCAGVRILEGLGDTNSTKQSQEIVKILHDYVISKNSAISGKKPENEQGVDINQAIIASMKLAKIALIDPRFISFSGINLQNMKFGRVNFDKIVLDNATLNDIDFSYSNVGESSFAKSKQKNVAFAGSFLYNSDFKFAEVIDGTFWGSTLIKASFFSAKLMNADFAGAKLHGTDFSHADLTGANFSGANLQCANFTGANLKNARIIDKNRLAGIIYDKNDPPKNLPDGFVAPKNRAYEKKNPKAPMSRYCFVESNAEWSGADVEEYIKNEIAEAKNEAKPLRQHHLQPVL